MANSITLDFPFVIVYSKLSQSGWRYKIFSIRSQKSIFSLPYSSFYHAVIYMEDFSYVTTNMFFCHTKTNFI